MNFASSFSTFISLIFLILTNWLLDNIEIYFTSGKFLLFFLFSSVQLLSHVQLFVTPWTAAHQASLFITNFWSLLKLMPIEWVMPSNHLILCHPFLLQPSIFPSIRVSSNESVLRIRWPKYWSFSFSIHPSNEYSGIFDFLVKAGGAQRRDEVMWYGVIEDSLREVGIKRDRSLKEI